jgi:hypothetical protein
MPAPFRPLIAKFKYRPYDEDQGGGVQIGLARIVYIYAAFDCVFGDFPAKIPLMHRIHIHGSGQPYSAEASVATPWL